MKADLRVFMAMLLCLAIGGLQAATIVGYDAGVAPAAGAAPAADPAVQGWTFDSGTVSGNQYAAGYDSGNGGWRTVDGTSSAPAFHSKNFDALADNMAYGWSYTAVVSMDSDAIGSAGGFVDDYYLPPNNDRQKSMYLWVETVADKSYLVQLTIDADSNLWGNDGTTDHQLTTDGSAYDTFKTLTIDYDGTSATLTCGTTTVAIADRAVHGQNRVVFGSVSSGDQGSAIWNSVKLDAPVVFYDDFSYGTTQGALDFGWEEVVAGSWGVDAGPLWGNLMVLRYITDTVIEAGAEVTIEVDRNREGDSYTYSGDLIAWNGLTATVLGSFSFAGGTDPATHTFTPISGAYAGQQIGFTFSHSNGWGETNSIKLTSVTLSTEPYATNPNPANGAPDVPVTTDLSWMAPGAVAIASYDVYADPNEENLNAADAAYYSSAQVGTTLVLTGDLDYGTTYHWRVDTREPNDALHTGYLWSFETLSPDPKLTSQPENQLVWAGETAEFLVTAVNPFTGDDTGMSYQWYKVGDPDDEAVGTGPTLTYENALVANEGLYYCVITVDAPPAGVTSNPVTSDTVKLLVKRMLGNWQFEDDLTDASGNGYDGTPVGTPVYDAIPADDPSRQVSGKALHCTVGGSDYAEIPASVFGDIDTQVTISLWTWGVDQPNEGNQSTWIVKDSGGSTIAYMMIPHSTARIDTRMGNADDGMDTMYEGTSAPSSWFNGQWNHWVLTKDSETGVMRIYRNAELHYELTNATKPFYGAATFYVGGNNDTPGAFGGYIDDVRVYNYALTEEDVAAIHARPMFPDPTDGQSNVAFNPTLNWTQGDGTSEFKVYIGDVLDPDPNIILTDPITILGLTEPTTALPVNLKLETTYYWYVEEYDGVSPDPIWTSDLWDFTVRELKADIDENSAVLLSDLLTMAGRWTDDVRGTPEPVLLDDGIYDPNSEYLPDDPTNYAYYWQTYWTYTGGLPGESTGGNALYGTGYCEPVDDPNEAIAWHYDTPSSTGTTDTVMWYYHGDRPSAPISNFDELRVEIKAAPGSVIKDNPYTWIGDADGNWVGYTFGGISALLGDNEWHELVWPLRSISGTSTMGNFLEFDVGYWGGGLTGTFYFRNARLINNDGTIMCLPIYYIPEDLNFDCLVNLDDFAIMAEEWLLDARNPL